MASSDASCLAEDDRCQAQATISDAETAHFSVPGVWRRGPQAAHWLVIESCMVASVAAKWQQGTG